MKEGWTYKKLGEVSSFQNGFAFKSNLFRKEGYPIVRISNIQNEEILTDDIVYFNKEDYPVNFDNYKIYPNDILIAMSGGTTGKLGMNTTQTIFYQNQRVGVIREDNKTLNHRYLFYFLHTKSEESLKIAAGAAQPNLSTAQIKDFVIPLPSLSEQQQIVSRLDAAFTQIDALKANAEKQLTEARKLFQAELAECMRPKEGWKKKTFQEVIKLQSGDNLPAKKYVEGHYPVYGGNGIAGYHNSYNHEGENIVIGRVGALCGNVHYINNPIWLTDNGFEVIINSQYNINKKFLSQYLTYLDLGKYARQAAQPVISNASLKDLVINIPSFVEQNQIVNRLETLSANIKKLVEMYEKAIAECDALKQAVLKEVFE